MRARNCRAAAAALGWIAWGTATGCSGSNRVAFAEAETIGVFAETPCEIELPEAFASWSARCGTVGVPELHGVETGQAISIPVVVFRNPDLPPSKPPVFWLEGGPGAASVVNASGRLEAVGTPLAEDRELVFFDQRGVGRAQPDLECPGGIGDTSELSECFEQLEARGHNTSAYTSVQNAADIDVLRQALGYETLTLYGTSYGTRLGLQYLRGYAERVASVVLDGVLPPDAAFLRSSPERDQEALSRVFARCLSDALCASRYPELEQIYLDTAVRLSEQPIELVFSDDEGNQFRLPLTQASFVSGLIGGGLLVPGFPALLPRVVYAVNDLVSGATTIDPILGIAAAGIDSVNESLEEVFSLEMHLLIACSDNGAFGREDILLSGVPAAFHDLKRDELALYLGTCPVWARHTLSAEDQAPVTSNVPMLLLSGGFDAQTPVSFGDLASTANPAATHVVFPTLGHVVISRDPCPDAVIGAFLREPTEPVASDCIDSIPFAFSFPENDEPTANEAGMNALANGRAPGPTGWTLREVRPGTDDNPGVDKWRRPWLPYAL